MQPFTEFVRSANAGTRQWLLAAEIAAIAILCSAVLTTDFHRIQTGTTGDFQHFYYAADAMNSGRDPYTAWTHGYIYPPLIAFLFQPLASLGIDRAAMLMLGVNVTLTLLATALAADEFLRRFSAPRDAVVTAGLMLLAMLLNLDKIKGEWQMWQTDVFMLLLFVVALRWLDRRPFAAGIFLGIAVNIKYLPLLFLPYLLLRRRWRCTAGLVVGTIAFAILPAARTGWDANLRNWNTATHGLLQMADLQTAPTEAAEIHDVRDSLSCSVTSAFARGTWTHPHLGFSLAALTAFSCLLLAGWMYQRHGFSLVFGSRVEPGALTGAEWVMLVAAVLAFGPQTNTRHLFDCLIFTTAASVLLVFPNPRTTLTLLIGTIILFLGFILPPGSRTYHGERTPAILWLRLGGPCWCLLIAAFTLLWTTLDRVRQRPLLAPASSGEKRV